MSLKFFEPGEDTGKLMLNRLATFFDSFLSFISQNYCCSKLGSDVNKGVGLISSLGISLKSTR